MLENTKEEVFGVFSVGSVVHFADLASLVGGLVANIDLVVRGVRTLDRLGVGIPGVPPGVLDVAYEVALTVLLVVTLYRLYERFVKKNTTNA